MFVTQDLFTFKELRRMTPVTSFSVKIWGLGEK